METNNKPYFVAEASQDIPESFPLSRMLHCHNVGLRMYSYAKQRWGWPQDRCDDMYILGMMHDIGYELNPDPYEHDEAMAKALGHAGYKYIEEIRHHSFLQTDYDTPEMQLLYFGDSTVDGKGRWCTFEERLKDVEERHGKGSAVYQDTLAIIEHLKSLGFDDTITPEDYISCIHEAQNTGLSHLHLL